jgi:hypothetical protein
VPQGVPFYEGAVYPGVFLASTPGIIAAYRSNDVDIRTFTSGFQTGFNITAGGFLVGVEADINFMNAQKAKTTSLRNSQFCTPTTLLLCGRASASQLAARFCTRPAASQ